LYLLDNYDIAIYVAVAIVCAGGTKMVTLNRYCIGCRRIIQETQESPVLVIGQATVKWNKKQHKHSAKTDGEYDCFCEICAARMMELIKAQREKGVKVL